MKTKTAEIKQLKQQLKELMGCFKSAQKGIRQRDKRIKELESLIKKLDNDFHEMMKHETEPQTQKPIIAEKEALSFEEFCRKYADFDFDSDSLMVSKALQEDWHYRYKGYLIGLNSKK